MANSLEALHRRQYFDARRCGIVAYRRRYSIAATQAGRIADPAFVSPIAGFVTGLAGLAGTLGILFGPADISVAQRCLLLFEITYIAILFVAAPIYLMHLMRGRRRVFPKLVLHWLAISGLVGTSYFLVQGYLETGLRYWPNSFSASLPDGNTDRFFVIGLSLMVVVIWFQYMATSPRVAETFVRGRPLRFLGWALKERE